LPREKPKAKGNDELRIPVWAQHRDDAAAMDWAAMGNRWVPCHFAVVDRCFYYRME
jgi:hypothetical protein